MATFSTAGEGILDLAVARKLLALHGHTVFAEFDKKGKDQLDASLAGYLNASRFSPWLIMRDLDEQNCVVQLLDNIAPNRANFPHALIRISVRSVESWLMADRSGFSRFFGISSAVVQRLPDGLENPKGALVQCVLGSRRRNLREGIVPRVGSGRKVGPEYNAVLSDYIENVWSVDRAVEFSESLRRSVNRIAQY